jgi:hypothetical protein
MTSPNPLANPAPWNLVASEYAAEVAPIFAWFTAAGFESVEVHEVAHAQPAMTTRQAWAWMVRATAPIALLRQSLGPTKWAGFETCVLAKLIEAFGEEGRSMQRKANLSVGRKRM